MRKIPIHLPIFISGTILILLFGLGAGYFVLFPNNIVASFVSEKLGMTKLAQSTSTVDVSASGGHLRLQFNVVEKDQSEAVKLSENLGVGLDWEKGIDVGLDEKTLSTLEPFLPMKANLGFSDKKILISSRSFSFLKSAIPNKTTEFATGSGKLSFGGEGNAYHLKVEGPTDLLNHATNSGVINLSTKVMSSVFSIGDKIATIELNLSGKNLDGEIVLK